MSAVAGLDAMDSEAGASTGVAAATIGAGGLNAGEAARSGRGGSNVANATTLASDPQMDLPWIKRQSRQSRWARSEIAWSVTVLPLVASETPSVAKDAIVKAGGSTHPVAPDARAISRAILRVRMAVFGRHGSDPGRMHPKA